MALFGKKSAPPAPTPLEQLPQQLQELIQKAQEERTKISSLLGRTKGSVEKLEKLDAPLNAVADRAEDALHIDHASSGIAEDFEQRAGEDRVAAVGGVDHRRVPPRGDHDARTFIDAIGW